MLRYEGQVKLPATLFKQGLKCGSDSGFVCNAEPVKLLECGVVGFDGLVGGFEGEGGHVWVSVDSLIRSIRTWGFYLLIGQIR